MGISNVTGTGRAGMVAAKANIATTGHNIANANTAGFSRQRVHQSSEVGVSPLGRNIIGQGVTVSRTERVNDEYVEKQIRNAGRDLAQMEEKDLVLRQTEDIFNEMGGEGLNRMMARFFNEFRKLSNEPENEAVRQSVREASAAMVNDFKRLRSSVEDVRRHIDHRIEGFTRDINTTADQIRELNIQIKQQEITGGSPNDLLDKRDQALRKLGTYMDLTMHKAEDGQFTVEMRGVGPLVVGTSAETLSISRTPADDEGKNSNLLDITTSGKGGGPITHSIKGGKLGSLLEVRDKTLGSIVDRLDELAFSLTQSVNSIHTQGFSRTGQTGIAFFKPVEGRERASEVFDLSDEIKSNVNSIATAAEVDAPGDNRIAIALSGLQNARLMNDGQSTVDDYYNSIVGDVGVISARNRSGMSQAKDISTQLGKIRDQISGVSIDEETANLMQFQHLFGASAKVIQVADEMFRTVLDLKR